MSYTKKTSICGRDSGGEWKSYLMHGHWAIEKAVKKGREAIVGDMSIEHVVFDDSGRGRGGHDGRWDVDENNNIKIVSKFEEVDNNDVLDY